VSTTRTSAVADLSRLTTTVSNPRAANWWPVSQGARTVVGDDQRGGSHILGQGSVGEKRWAGAQNL